MLALFAQLDRCARSLLEACALYLDLPREFLAQTTINSPTLLRVLHYPPVPPDRPAAQMRAAAHEDINLITLLCEATAPGLELWQTDGTWLPIAAIPGQIIVDTGDMLQNLTNGLFKSTTHRVTNPANDRDRRFSLPFFCPSPSRSGLVAPAQLCQAHRGRGALSPVDRRGVPEAAARRNWSGLTPLMLLDRSPVIDVYLTNGETLSLTQKSLLEWGRHGG